VAQCETAGKLKLLNFRKFMFKPGDILRDRYQLQELLGANLIHSTWLVRDLAAPNPTSDRAVLKLLALGGHVHWEHLKLFEREARVLQNLNHSQIPKYRDYFSIDERSLWFGLVEDYIPGSSLKELLDGGKTLTESEIRQFATEILQILIYLHGLTPLVLHRDIKPSNMIIGEDRKIYLIDFGAVQHQAASTEGASFTIVGTYGYTPMEQFGGRAVPASDLYALGATLIHLLTGTSPSDLPQKEFRIEFRDRATLHPSLANWLQKLTEPQAEQRFQTASQALEALELGITPAQSSLKFSPTSTLLNNSGCGNLFDSSIPIPEEIKGWNWGAFFLPAFWPLTNSVWLGLLAWTPYLGSIMGIILAIKGNEWAWKSKKWRSIEHFNKHQRGWAIAGLFIGIPITWIYLYLMAALLHHAGLLKSFW
jgi:serine/threonine protein kinase